MDEDTQLKARIAALSGRINKRKQDQQYSSPGHFQGSRWSPYRRGGGHIGHQTPHRNRTLVLKSVQNAPATTPETGVPNVATLDSHTSPTPFVPTFVSTRRAGTNQLVNKDIFERQQKQKQGGQEQAAMQSTSVATTLAKPDAKPIKITPHGIRELEIEGIRFQMLDDGSKLIRLSGELSLDPHALAGLSVADDADLVKQTPKKVKIAAVEFFRTKHGNLVRASIARDSGRPVKRAQKPQCEHFTKNGTYRPIETRPNADAREWKCFTRTKQASRATCAEIANMSLGTCPFGPACKFTHDPTKTAICKEFLRNGSCPAGKNCDLSHEPTYHRVSACTHFLRGNCTNSACRYPHLHVSSAAPVCRAFATLGFCSKGSDCDKRHVLECPDYSNHGHCTDREKGICSLPHVDHASALRKAAQRQAKTGTEDESDVTSDEDDETPAHDSDEIDSDIDVFTGSDGDTHELSQQKDFISFA